MLLNLDTAIIIQLITIYYMIRIKIKIKYTKLLDLDLGTESPSE